MKSKAPSDKDGGQEPDKKEEEEPQLGNAIWVAKLKYLQVACIQELSPSTFWFSCLFVLYSMISLQEQVLAAFAAPYRSFIALACLEYCFWFCTMAVYLLSLTVK